MQNQSTISKENKNEKLFKKRKEYIYSILKDFAIIDECDFRKFRSNCKYPTLIRYLTNEDIKNLDYLISLKNKAYEVYETDREKAMFFANLCFDKIKTLVSELENENGKLFNKNRGYCYKYNKNTQLIQVLINMGKSMEIKLTNEIRR